MSKTKKPNPAETPVEPATVEAPVFSKSKILTFSRYAARRDALSSILKDGMDYTIEQVDHLLENFMKGKVK